MKENSFCKKVKNKLFKLYLILRKDLKVSCICKDNYYNEKYYHYLEKKYHNNLEKIPYYKSTGKFSNKVWWCWLQGEENAPKLQRACLASLRKNLKNRDIIVITNDNFNEYINLPSYIIEKYKKGIISNAHFSDIIRLELLIKYGGTWIDSTVYCTKYNPRFFDKSLFVYSAFMRGDESMISSSWFITSEINNPILLTTRELLYLYWQNHDYLIHYFLFHLFFAMAARKYSYLYAEVGNFPNVSPHVLQFELENKFSKDRFEEIKKMSDFHKLNGNKDFTNKEKDTFYDYIVGEYKN